MATISVQIQLGQGDVSVNIFNDTVTYEHYFANSGTWNCPLASGHYLVGIAGTCPPGGSVTIDFSGIINSNPPFPITINTAGPFLRSATINA